MTFDECLIKALCVMRVCAYAIHLTKRERERRSIIIIIGFFPIYSEVRT